MEDGVGHPPRFSDVIKAEAFHRALVVQLDKVVIVAQSANPFLAEEGLEALGEVERILTEARKQDLDTWIVIPLSTELQHLKAHRARFLRMREECATLAREERGIAAASWDARQLPAEDVR